MSKQPADAKRRIIQAAYDLFYKRGFARVSVDLIAGKAGFTKRTLYYHFKSKDHLVAEVVQFHHVLAMERIRVWSDQLTGELDEFLDSLFSQLADWAANPRWAGPGFTRIAMELADLPGHPARAVASRHKIGIEAWLAGEFARKGVAAPDQLARQVVLLIEGATALMLIHGDRRYAKAAADAAKALAVSRGFPPAAKAPGRVAGRAAKN
jgi:AcrR family transcriptional regulator